MNTRQLFNGKCDLCSVTNEENRLILFRFSNDIFCIFQFSEIKIEEFQF